VLKTGCAGVFRLESSLVPGWNQTLDCPAHSVVTTPTTPKKLAIIDGQSTWCGIPEYINLR